MFYPKGIFGPVIAKFEDRNYFLSLMWGSGWVIWVRGKHIVYSVPLSLVSPFYGISRVY